jgi:hypothetical protein
MELFPRDKIAGVFRESRKTHDWVAVLAVRS